MTEDRVPTLNVITAHIEREARRIGTYHGDPAATPGGTGYCIPAAVATQIVDKYLSEQPAPPLDDEGPLHYHSDDEGTAIECRTLHREQPAPLLDVPGGHRHGPDEFICDDGDCPRAQPAPPFDVERLRQHEPEPGMGNYATWRWDCSCGWYDNDSDAQKWWTHVLGSEAP